MITVNEKHIFLCGMRGNGKRSLARAIARSFINERPGARSEWIDLEDPRHAPGPRAETVDVYVRAGGDRPPELIVLLGMASMPGWIDFVSRINRYDGIKFIMTFSGNPDIVCNIFHAQGDIDVIEVNNTGFGKFRAKEPSSGPGESLLDFLGFGKEPDEEQVRRLREIILMDILLRHEVRDVKKLTDMTVYLLESSGTSISANQLKRHSLCSLDKARAFLGHIEESGLVHLIRREEDSGRERNEAGRLCFAGSVELIRAAARGPLDGRRLALTAVYHELRRFRLPMSAWRLKGCEGLLLHRPDGTRLAVDCCWGDAAGARRRTARVMARYGALEGLLLSRDAENDECQVPAGTLRTRSLDAWLLQPTLEGEALARLRSPAPARELAEQGAARERIPSHLL